MLEILQSLLEQAMAKRTAVFRCDDTNCFRVVDGEGDGMPGVIIDHLDGRWLVITTGDVPFPAILRRWRPEACRSVYWKRRIGEQKACPTWIQGERAEDRFLVKENGVIFEMAFQSGYSQGLFLDQRENRQRVRETVRAAGADGQRVLNCFSYTCGFSVTAALGGALTTSIDLSSPYLQWGKRHFELNGLRPEEHHFCRGDVLHWLVRFGKQGRSFDGIILDPPTFSRSKDGGVFQAGKDYEGLVAAAACLLRAGGWLLCSCNEARLDASRFHAMITRGCCRCWNQISLKALPMPFDFSGTRTVKSAWVTVH